MISNKNLPSVQSAGSGQKTVSADWIKEAIHALASDMPNSFLADLLVYFQPSVAIKLIETFPGRVVRIPKIDDVWRSYRNHIITATLDQSNTRTVREQLASYFGINSERVRNIYFFCNYKAKKTVNVKPKTVANTVAAIRIRNRLLAEIRSVKPPGGKKHRN